MKRLLCALLGLTLAAGCTLGPDYRRPNVTMPQTYRWADAGLAAAGSFGDLGWWQVYRDPQLQRLLHTALAQNPDVRIAAARIEEARAALGVSRIAQLPQVAAGVSQSRSETSEFLTSSSIPRVRDTDTIELSASWEIDLWGRLRRASEAARADLLAASDARDGVMVGLVADVASGYFNLQALDEQLEITRHTVATREKFVELTRAQHDRGVVSGLDVATAEAQLATARANVPDLERQIAQAEDALSVLLGENPGSITREAIDAADAPVPPPGIPSTLLERRPDLRAAEAQLKAANARVGVAKAALFPTLSLTAALGTQSTALDGLFTGPARIWTLGGGLVQPLLDSQRNLFQVDLADARKREAILNYQKAVQAAFRDVADALIQRSQSEAFEREQAQLVAALQRADNIALARYRIGFSSYFDVINAERDLFNAELALSAAHRNTRLAVVQIYRALGGGWQASPSPASSAAAPAP